MPRRPDRVAAPRPQVVEEAVEGRPQHQRDDGRKGEAAYDGAGHGEVGRPVAADLCGAEAEGDEAQDRRGGRHEDGSHPLAPAAHQRLVSGQVLAAEQVDVVDEHDVVVPHDADEDERPDPRHNREAGARDQKEPEDAHSVAYETRFLCSPATGPFIHRSSSGGAADLP